LTKENVNTKGLALSSIVSYVLSNFIETLISKGHLKEHEAHELGPLLSQYIDLPNVVPAGTSVNAPEYKPYHDEDTIPLAARVDVREGLEAVLGQSPLDEPTFEEDEELPEIEDAQLVDPWAGMIPELTFAQLKESRPNDAILLWAEENEIRKMATAIAYDQLPQSLWGTERVVEVIKKLIEAKREYDSQVSGG